jgi:transposase-like protein
MILTFILFIVTLQELLAFAVWLYLGFRLSLHDIYELFAMGDIDRSYE